MNGRDLIIYILSNNLENKPVYENGKFLGLLTAEEAAIKFNVGTATIKAWFDFGMLDGVKLNDKIYIFPNSNLLN